MTRTDLLHLYLRFGLIPIPLRSHSSEPLVKWRRRWNPTHEELEAWASRSDINWAVHCGENLAVINCDCADVFHSFTATCNLLTGCPVVKTGRNIAPKNTKLQPKSETKRQNKVNTINRRLRTMK